MREKPLILIVDDNRESRDILETRIRVNDYDTITAADGEAGLQLAREKHPDLILLDVLMPKMDGLEVCRRIKNDGTLPLIPIILVTAKSDVQDVIAGLEAGGDEYLTKPVDHSSLMARVRSMLRIKQLHDTVSEQSALLRDQLKTAARVQSLFWPEIPDLEGSTHLWAASFPAAYVGGDLYDVIQLDDATILAYVADVAGKGVPAALIMAALSARIRAASDTRKDICGLMNSVNSSIYDLACDEGYFVTVIMARLWPATGKVELVRAGHPAPVWAGTSEILEPPPIRGMAIGVEKNLEFESRTLTLSPGHSLLLYSDGITEAENSDHELFGMARFSEILLQGSGPPWGEHIIHSVASWRGDMEINDDLTLLEIWRDS